MTEKDERDGKTFRHEHHGFANDESPIEVMGADEEIDEDRPGEWSDEGLSEPQPLYLDAPGGPRELRDQEVFAQRDRGRRSVRGNEGNERHHPEVAEIVGTTGLACGIGDTDYPCGVMADEDPDSSGGASDLDQGF